MRRLAEEIRQGKRARQQERRDNLSPSQEYIKLICCLYGDVYDDREEDSRIKGMDWDPGRKASHKSLAAFQKELDEIYGIHLSRTIVSAGNLLFKAGNITSNSA